MGNWNMTVNGVGQHHQTAGHPMEHLDAEKLFAEFVESLKDKGHSIQYAAITYGARQTKEIDPNKY